MNGFDESKRGLLIREQWIVSKSLLDSFRKGPYRSGGSNAVPIWCGSAAKQGDGILGNLWSDFLFGGK